MPYVGPDLPSTNRYHIDTFTGDGSTVEFTLAFPPGSKGSIAVIKQGIILPVSSYTLTGTILTLDAAPADQEHLEVRHLGGIINVFDDTQTVVINTQTGTTYTLVLIDADNIVEMNNASPNTLTVPPNSSVAFDVGTRIDLVQIGAGQTTIAEGAGVTINSEGAALKLTAQYTGATIYKRSTDEWVLLGNITT